MCGRLRLAAATGALLLAGCSQSPTQPRPVYGTVDSSGVALHTRILGNGAQVIVLLHGGPGLSLQEMNPFDSLLTPRRRLVAFDERGSGLTGPPANGDLTITAQVADIEAVRRTTGADRIWLLGQSWGGLLAGAYVAAHPEHVAGLALVGAAPPDLTAFNAGQDAFARRLAQLQDRGLVPKHLPDPANGSCLPALRGEAPAYARDPNKPPHQPAGLTCTPGTAQRTYAAVIRPDILTPIGRELAAYKRPALVVAGSQDPFGPQWPQAWKRLLPQAQQLDIANAGHAPVLENPGVLLTALDRFFDTDGTR